MPSEGSPFVSRFLRICLTAIAAAALFSLEPVRADDDSLIFPSVQSVVPDASPRMRRTIDYSTGQQTVQPLSHEAPLLSSASSVKNNSGDIAFSQTAPAKNYQQLSEQGDPARQPSCPECGCEVDHPFLGMCGKCLSSGRRLMDHIFHPGLSDEDRLQRIAQREPWTTRPYSVSLFYGPIVGTSLIDQWTSQQTGYLAGVRFGYDFADDWGLEGRLASADIPIVDEPASITAAGAGYTYTGSRSSDHFLFDIDMLYYPWGDAAFRPYLLFGLGTDRIKFQDAVGVTHNHVMVGMPVGVGFKYRMSEWLIFRAELTDNIAFAGAGMIQTQNNLSMTGALEVRFGRSKTTYWPWNPGTK